MLKLTGPPATAGGTDKSPLALAVHFREQEITAQSLCYSFAKPGNSVGLRLCRRTVR
jgi:hypothetical protein